MDWKALRIKGFERPFRKLTFSDREWIDKACNEDRGLSSHACFVSMIMTQDLYEGDRYRKGMGGCVVKKPWAKDGVLHWQYPIGSPRFRKKMVRKVVDIYSGKYDQFQFWPVSEDYLKELYELFGDKVTEVSNDPDGQEYIYDVKEHISLEGPGFSNIRSKLRRFDKNHNWTYEAVTKDNLEECIKINEEWYEGHEKTESSEVDQRALKKVFRLFDEYGFRGGILRVDGKAIAFNLGVAINDDVIVGLFAKAFTEYQYSSVFMIHEFIKQACSEFKYFNFTADVGEPGLRKFKNDMKPAFKTSEYTVMVDLRK